MNLDSLWQSLQDSSLGTYVSQSTWAFPTIESLHVISIVTVVGTIAVMDLRLIGLASRDCAVTAISRDTLRWTWGSFVLAVITGLLLFVSNATGYVGNPWFIRKMVVIVLAGINMGIFHVLTWRSVGNWDANCEVPTAGKVAGTLSLILWILVVFFGRAIGFTLGAEG